MSMTAKAPLLRLLAPLFGATLMASSAVAEGPMKGADFLRVVADQMHQLQIVKVGTFAFRTQTSAIGQIGYNEDASTIVLTPFSGRVTRLIAKPGDQVKKGDPLLEIEKQAPSTIWHKSSTGAFAIFMRARLHRPRICSRPRRSSPRPKMTCDRPIRRSRPRALGCGFSDVPMRKS